jgi:toxin ParE1/3/4
MVKLIWTDQAIDDLEAGRIVPEKGEESVRELIEGNYRIIYEVVSDNLIYILTVYHSARDLRG